MHLFRQYSHVDKVGNVKSWNVDNWKADIQLAKNGRIDGFALNIAYGEMNNGESIEFAFQAAKAMDFKMIFSFDYAGKGAWPEQSVIDLINSKWLLMSGVAMITSRWNTVLTTTQQNIYFVELD